MHLRLPVVNWVAGWLSTISLSHTRTRTHVHRVAAEAGHVEILKISSLLNLWHKITWKLTFENVYQCAALCPICTMDTHTHTHTHTHVRAHTQTHRLTDTQTHIHTHTRAHAFPLSLSLSRSRSLSPSLSLSLFLSPHLCLPNLQHTMTLERTCVYTSNTYRADFCIHKMTMGWLRLVGFLKL